MKRIHPWPPVAATTITISIIYVVCTLLFVLFPNNALSFFREWFHGIDLAKISKESVITFSSFLIGLVEIVIFTAVFTLIFVLIYNSCVNHCKKKGWIKENK